MMKVQLLVEVDIEGDFDETHGAYYGISELIGAKIREESVKDEFLDMNCYEGPCYISKINVYDIFSMNSNSRWIEKGDSYYSDEINLSDLRNKKINTIIQ